MKRSPMGVQSGASEKRPRRTLDEHHGYCMCGASSSPNELSCPCYDLELLSQPEDLFQDVEADVLFSDEPKAELDPANAQFLRTIKEEPRKPPTDFMLTVPTPTFPLSEEDAPPARGGAGTCVRYTRVEEQALVHAKLRLQLRGYVGYDDDQNLLLHYYQYYLMKLDPQNFRKYQERESTALVRKFKAIKQKNPKLVAYIDPNVDNRFWHSLKELVAHKPLLHSLFYPADPDKKVNAVCQFFQASRE